MQKIQKVSINIQVFSVTQEEKTLAAIAPCISNAQTELIFGSGFEQEKKWAWIPAHHIWAEISDKDVLTINQLLTTLFRERYHVRATTLETGLVIFKLHPRTYFRKHLSFQEWLSHLDQKDINTFLETKCIWQLENTRVAREYSLDGYQPVYAYKESKAQFQICYIFSGSGQKVQVARIGIWETNKAEVIHAALSLLSSSERSRLHRIHVKALDHQEEWIPKIKGTINF